MTLEELLSKGLKKTDLIWIEGRSAAWSFPSEIEHLKEHLPSPDNGQKNTAPAQPEPVQPPKQEAVAQTSPEQRVEPAFLTKSKLVHVILPQRPPAKQTATQETVHAENSPEKKNAESRTKTQPGNGEYKSRLASPVQATQKMLFPEDKVAAPVPVIPEPAVPAPAPVNEALNPATDVEQVSIEEKAEALRKKIAAFNAQKNSTLR